MSNSTVSPRPAGEGWRWIEEFGGGEWVQDPPEPTEKLDGARAVVAGADAVARAALRNMIYCPGYQGPPPTRATTGVWIDY